MKTAHIVGISLMATLMMGCTTVRTYDRNGEITGMCRVSGLFRGGGACVGYANDDGVARRDPKNTKVVQKVAKTTPNDDMFLGGR